MTLYFYNTTDNNWDTLTNWYTDLGITPSGVLPSDGDTVYIATEIDSGPSISVTLLQINIADSSTGGGSFSVNITNSLGPAIFNSSSANIGTIGDYAIFNDYSSSGGNVGDHAIFNDSSYINGGNVGNYATFSDYSSNRSIIGENAAFNDYSYNSGGYTGANTTFNNYSYADAYSTIGDGSGIVTFNDASYFEYGCTINDAVAYRNTGLIVLPEPNETQIGFEYGMEGGTQSIGTLKPGGGINNTVGII